MEIPLAKDALVSVCSWNTNVIRVWAWMLWRAYAPGTRTLSGFGHGCSGERMLLEHGGGCTCSKTPRTQGPRVDVSPTTSPKSQPLNPKS